jgi:hypothetical protein
VLYFSCFAFIRFDFDTIACFKYLNFSVLLSIVLGVSCFVSFQEQSCFTIIVFPSFFAMNTKFLLSGEYKKSIILSYSWLSIQSFTIIFFSPFVATNAKLLLSGEYIG